DRLVSETYTDAAVSRSYDSRGRLALVADSAGSFSFGYDAAGRLLASASPVGAVTYTRDSRGAVATRQVAGPALLPYGYDAAGNLTSAALHRPRRGLPITKGISSRRFLA